MTEIYATLSPTNDPVRYTSATPSVDYIDSNIESLFGPINAPKLYARELDALELASSGKIAFTLSNNHALDLFLSGAEAVLRARDTNSLKLITESSNVSVTLDELTDDLRVATANDFSATVGNDVGFSAGANVSLSAANAASLAAVAGTASVTAGDELLLQAVNDVQLASSASNVTVSARRTVDVSATDGDIRLAAGSNLVQSAALDADIQAGESVRITAATSIVQNTPLWQLEAADISLAAQNDLFASASNGVFVASGAADVDIQSGADVVVSAASNIVASTASGSVTVSSASNLDVVVSDAFTAVAGGAARVAASNAVVLESTQGAATLQAAGDLTLQSTSTGSVFINAPIDRKTHVQIGGANILEIYRTEYFDSDRSSNLTDYKVKINADVEVQGTTNSISVNESTLSVEDKIVYLAFNSAADLPHDGSANDGAGIRIDGIPDGADSNLSDRYEKSLKWHYGTAGISALGGSNIPGESYWNLRGGGLRITQVDETNGDEVSFGFRINQLQELEIYKMTAPAGGGTTTARVAKMGRTVA